MSASKVSPKLFVFIILALLFAVALSLRVYLPYDKIFSAEGIKYASADAYFHMRLVDNLVHNFPQHTAIDPYRLYPAATGQISLRFFVWLLAIPAWIISLGSPTQHTIDAVGVYLPAVLGALTVIPAYFIGKELFGRWAGVFSASLLAILPGEFLGRSILGFTDYHIAESLFTAVTMMFLILAIKTARQRQLTYGHLKHRDWATIRKPLIYSLLTAVFLGIYIFTWLGALLFVFIIAVYFVIQFIIDHLKGKSTDYLGFVGVIFFAVVLVISQLVSVSNLYPASLIIALLGLPVLSGLSWLMASKKIKPAYYPLAVLGLGLTGMGFLYLINPSLVSSMLAAFRIFRPAGAQLTTIEMMPLIRPFIGNGFWNSLSNSLALAWGNFNISFFLSFISLGILVYLIFKKGNAEKSLLVVWSLVILAATLGQRRFAYYFAVNVALLTGYLSWRVLEFAGFKELATEALETAKRAGSRKARPKKGGFSLSINHFVIAVALVIILMVVYAPNILFPMPNSDKSPTIATASLAPYAPSDAWVSSLTWMKENTPEPFGNPDAYYELHKPPPPGESYQYPESAYGVVAWWDYGYWITRIAHRLPIANPSQNPQALTSVATFFTSQDEKSANEIVQERDSAYIIIDHETALSKFWAIATWAGREPREYFDVYVMRQGDKWIASPLYYPEYYRSLAVRLYSFDGEAVIPEFIEVISYQENLDAGGNPVKVINGLQQFDTYEEAEAFVSSQDSDNYRIVGVNPFVSPVPLEAIEHYRPIHSSENSLSLNLFNSISSLVQGDTGALSSINVPSVKIFEYID
ncbi:oligosaccharyl transferase, archaeosortase A system-associated [Chloroflexota bacterium]